MNICAVAEKEVPKIYKSPQFRYKKDMVKKHIEIAVLSMLSDRPLSGYDIIKEILARYDVLISQGTIYSLLYALKDEGILQVGFTKGDLREKIYSCTQSGKQVAVKKIAEFIEADECFLISIKKFGNDV